ncbi:MAG: hypothetical protein WCK26_04395, partial [Candidatus Saccharibacteria bacterium]
MKSISKKIMYILSVVFVVCGMLLIMPGPLSADSVVELAGNYKVENLPGGLSGFEIDGNNVALGQYPSGSPVIEITQVFYKDGGSEAIGIQWNVISGSNAKIFIVAMKASNGYMLYTYDSPGATSGSNYTPLNSTNGKNYAISHIVFGYTIPNVTTAGIIINKAILGGNAATGVFSFNVYAAGSGGSPINGSPLTISITNGVSGTTTFTSASLIAGTTYYVEELATTGFTQNTANRVAVLAATSPASPANAAAFENTPNVTTAGIIINKAILGGNA